jgi:hypothetical protein
MNDQWVGRDNGDFDPEIRIDHFSVEHGPRWRGTGREPRRPDVVHVCEIKDVGEPDRSVEEVPLVAAGAREQPVDP